MLHLGLGKDHLYLFVWSFAYRRMPFGLCNVLATFQRCMMIIFYDMNEKFLEIFMDDFTLYGLTFETCLHNLSLVLQRY